MIKHGVIIRALLYHYRARLKASARFGEYEEEKIAFSCLLQARKRNIFT